MTKKNKRCPPSRLRYEQAHPVVSFRVKLEDHDRLNDLLEKSGKSIGDFFREALGVQEKDADEIYDHAVKEWQIWCYCKVCGKEIFIRPNGSLHKDIIERLKKSNWGHGKCHESKKINEQNNRPPEGDNWMSL